MNGLTLPISSTISEFSIICYSSLKMIWHVFCFFFFFFFRLEKNFIRLTRLKISYRIFWNFIFQLFLKCYNKYHWYLIHRDFRKFILTIIVSNNLEAIFFTILGSHTEEPGKWECVYVRGRIRFISSRITKHLPNNFLTVFIVIFMFVTLCQFFRDIINENILFYFILF